MEFRKQNDRYNIWLVGQVNNEKRGTKIGESKTESEAKNIALNKISKIDDKRWFSRYE
jgi:hypothetical protein